MSELENNTRQGEGAAMPNTTEDGIEVISYQNVAVGLFPFTKILSLEISHEPNRFGRCVVSGEMDAVTADDVSKRSDETSETEVITTAEGQPKRLFCGIVANVAVSHLTDYAQVTVTLLDTCKKLDIHTHQRSYQNTSLTYGQLIKNCMAGEGTATVTAEDKATGTLIVQYDETNWAFSQRMASQLGAPIISDIRADEPNLYVGLPPSDQTKDLTSSTFRFGKNTAAEAGAASASAPQVSENLSDMGLKSYYYTFIGNYVQVGSSFYAVKSIYACLVDGLLTMNYGLLPMGNEQPAAGSMPELKGLSTPSIANKSCSGKMLTGKVVEVDKNKVQVQFSFDQEFNGNHWFEYSTAYSSSDKSGWYCMPEKGDTVRVFFPSGNEGEAFAASSAPAFHGLSPKDKIWMAHGKFIQLTEHGIKICCGEEEAFIDLTPTEGIVISCKQNISINAEGTFEVNAKDIALTADNKISLGTDRAFIDITEDKITLLGSEVVIE